MKIHEQEWSSNGGNIRNATGLLVAIVAAPDAGALIVSAPEMARALLAHGRFAVEPNGDASVWHTHACWETNRAVCLDECRHDRAALRSAGVL